MIGHLNFCQYGLCIGYYIGVLTFVCLITNESISSYVLYQFLRAAVTNHHTLGGLKQQKCFVSQFWKPEVPTQSVGRAVLLLKALRKNPSVHLLISGGTGIPWLVAA